MDYFYPPINRDVGYDWHLLYKCWIAIGRWPRGSGDSGGYTILSFDPPLTPEEKVSIDLVMANPDTVLVPPAPTGTVFELKDIYNYWPEFLQSLGIPDLSDPRQCTQWYVDSVPGSRLFDIIRLQFPRVLKQQEINTLQSVYASMIRKP